MQQKIKTFFKGFSHPNRSWLDHEIQQNKYKTLAFIIFHGIFKLVRLAGVKTKYLFDKDDSDD